MSIEVSESPLDAEIQRLRGENIALESVLYGLCMGLARMSDVHREVVAQAFDYAGQSPRAVSLRGEPDNGPPLQAFGEVVGQLKEVTLGRLGAARF